jgi:small subunit ribosomal protein S2
MKRFIMTERNGIYIIDLQQSLTYINDAYEFIKETVAHGGTILFVGTKKQAQEPIADQATRVGMPYVTYRWLGGMLTNFQTVSKRLSRLKELEDIDFTDVAGSGRTKKELLVMKREKVKLEKTLGGIRDMAKIPSAVWIVDTKKEHLAVTEARKLKLPVIAILDTNCDPDEVDYKIPGNDDAIRSVTLLTRVVADAVAEGLMARAAARGGGEVVEDGTVAVDEPMAEWERELLAGAEVAAAPAPDAAEAPATEAAATEVPATEAPVGEVLAARVAEALEAPAAAPDAEAAVAEAPAAEADTEVALAVLDTEGPAAPAAEAPEATEAPATEV